MFWALLASHVVSRLGGFVMPFLVLYLTDSRGLAAGTAATVLAAAGSGMVASQIVGGWLADRLGRRPTMVAGFVGNAMALIALAHGEAVPVIATTAFMVGLTGELFRPALYAAVADVVPPHHRGRAYGLLVWGANVGFSLSAALGGFLSAAGFGVLFWVNALTSTTAALIIIWFVPYDRAPKPSGVRRLLPTAIRDRLLLASTGAHLLYGVVYFQAFSTLPLMMTADGLPTRTYGLLIAGNGALIVVLQPIAGRLLGHRDHAMVLASSMFMVGSGFAVGASAHQWPQYAVSVVIWTIGEIGAATALGPVFATLAPPDLRGGYMGMSGFAWAAGAALGPILGTMALDRLGRPGLLLGCALLGVILSAVYVAMSPGLRARAAAQLTESVGEPRPV
ncbi:MDR family MFS transporter [Asanoa siamensis]|uniref:MFS transporter n=1 Tax=Asanoa siamensis TaxID=926357 RepID=A0ABQ4D2T9_9ACTN|nr:MFS transporter [Asanoa siamensis]